MIVRLVILLAGLISLASAQECGGNWKKNGNFCYLAASQQTSWEDARRKCGKEQADLAIITDAGVNQFLTDWLMNTGFEYWVGLHDKKSEDSWEWIDGSTAAYTNWHPGEPNNSGGGENCAEIWPARGGTWNDDTCTKTTMSYICQRSIDTTILCDHFNGWLTYGDRCYYFKDVKKNWKGSEKWCNGLGATLVSVNSQDVQTFLDGIQLIYDDQYWIGFSDKDNAEGQYYWTDGSPPTDFVNWAPNQPDNSNFNNGGNCAHVKTTDAGQWSTKKCGDTMYYVCERDQGTCPTGWRIHQGHCYQVNGNNPMTWTDAKHYCDVQGAYMVTIVNDAENQWITSLMKELNDVGINDMYIGISDVVSDGIFKWTQGSSVSYTNWNPNQPYDRPGQDDCGSMYTGNQNGKWDTKGCYLLQAFICEIKAGRPVQPVPPDFGNGRCPTGWNLFGDYCYFISQTALSWQDADSQCKSQGGNSELVSIHTSEEQSFLTARLDISKTSTWIGLNDVAVEGAMEWTDGTVLDFTNWASGEPRVGDTGDCVRLKSDLSQFGQWRDSVCDELWPYICKRDKLDGTSAPPTVQPSRAHDLHCGDGWELNPDNGLCYMFRFGSYKTWQVARSQCRMEGGDLTSIDNSAENLYILDHAKNIPDIKAWIGGNDLSAEGGWEWSDGTAFRYIQWNTGEPNNSGGEHCMQDYFTGAGAGKWNDGNCDESLSYICKRSPYLSKNFYVYTFAKIDGYDRSILQNMWPNECAMECVKMVSFTCRSFDYDRLNRVCYLSDITKDTVGLTPTYDTYPYDHYERDMSVTTAQPPTPIPPTYGCSGDYRGYNGYCYKHSGVLEEYAQAQTRCRDDGAELTSILSRNENNFLLSYVYDVSSVDERHWIGLNDLTEEMYYEWDDGSDVTFTKWYYNEPNNQGEEDCVEVYYDGQWNDLPCTGFDFYSVCKKAMTDLGTLPPTDEGCADGWVAYLSSCYKFESGLKATWSSANSQCQAQGGHLVAQNDVNEIGFIASRLGVDTAVDQYWIGLSQNEWGSYVWVDGDYLWDTNWGEGEPDSGKGKCIMTNTHSTDAGYWYSAPCDTFMPYICERLRYGFTTTAAPPPVPSSPPNDVGCSAGWIGFGANCFLVQEMDGDQRANWFDARSICIVLGGDLASFHGPGEEQYISDTYQERDPANTVWYWIGLNDQAVEGGYEWSDRSPVDYVNWNDGEPNDYGGSEECVETNIKAGAGRWNDNDCYAERNFICKMPKGQAPRTPPPSPTPGTICPSDPEWTYRHPYCYYNSEPTDEGRKGWNEAEDYCHEKGGHLASIHDDDEQKFVNDMLRIFLVTEYWIGLREGTDSYQWSDETVLDYTNWANGQPDDNNGMEQCAEHYVDRVKGKWRDMNCGIPLAFVCKKDYDNINPITHLPTAPPQGGCPTNWIKLDDRCYHVEGISDAQKETWQGARDRCASLTPGGILAVIHSQRTQSELTALMRSVQSDVWIGLSDVGAESKFHWVDGSTMDYTNWAFGQPDGNILLPDGSKSDCVEMTNDMDTSGQWNDQPCNTYNSYLCQTMPNPSLPVIPPVSTACNSLPAGYTEYFGDCYKIGPNKLSFSAAKSYCEGDGTVLATISDGFQQAFVETQVFKNNGDSLYIGLLNDQTTGKFVWLDGWPVYYTKWGNGEPSLGTGEACVIVKANGKWDNVPCDGTYNPICKQNNGIKPTTHAPGEGLCLDGWLTYGDWCYKFDVERDFASWAEANDDCQRAHGAQLASIHSKQEMEFVRQNAQGVVGVRAIWLGMRRASSGEFLYEDGTPVDYVNWANGEPNGIGQDGGAQDCVEFTDDAYGKWYDDDCYRRAAYLCKMEKRSSLTPTTSLPTAAPCPTDPNWVYLHPYCYFVSAAIGNPVKSWSVANAWCMDNGGYLASIHSTQEQNFLNSIVRPLVPSYWIGLRETTGENDYQWIDGTPIDFVNWKTNQPDDYYGQEACAEIEVLTSNGKWNDLNCGISQAFICKKQYDNTSPVTIPATSKPEGGCPPDWYKLDDKCYSPMDGPLGFDDARLACQEFPGGDLASIHYQGVQSLMTSLIKSSPGLNVWIGANDRGSFGKFHWTDGTPFDYTNWAAGQPDGIATRPNDVDCVEMTNFDPVHPGKWDDVDCTLQRAYLCQRPLDPVYGPNPTFGSTCSRQGYQSYFESCYRIDTEPRVFADAKAMCEAEGAYLASIHDGYNEAFVETVMLNNGLNSVWIGLQQDESDSFKWVDDWPLLWTNWGQREPSSLPGEGCVVVTDLGTWDNVNCNLQQASICKYTSLPKPTTPAPVDGDCPQGWAPYGANCYKFDVRHDRASWYDAQYDCVQSGSNLASIHNQLENEFIRANAQRAIGVTRVWLGMSLNEGGSFEWVDGTALDYSNWANNEPQGDDRDNGCVDLYPDQYGKWEDTDCMSNGAYVCMLPKVTGEPTTRQQGTLPPGGTTRSQNTNVSGQPVPQTGLSSGAVVGIVFAVLIIFLSVALISFFIYKQQTTQKSPDIVGLQTTGFENVLYSGSDQGVNIESTSEVTPGSEA